MRHPFVAVWALAVVLGASLSGCARSDDPGTLRTFEPETTASSPSPKATAGDRDVCKLLTAKERKSIAGERIDIVAPARESSQCRWVKSLKVRLSTSITVQTSSAQDWVRLLPGLIDGTIAEGKADDKDIKRLVADKKRVAEGTDKIGNREACEMFASLVEAYRGEKEIRTMVTFQPSGDSASALAQTCSQGRFTALRYAERDLYPSSALNAAMLRVLGYAHERAIKRGSE